MRAVAEGTHDAATTDEEYTTAALSHTTGGTRFVHAAQACIMSVPTVGTIVLVDPEHRAKHEAPRAEPPNVFLEDLWQETHPVLLSVVGIVVVVFFIGDGKEVAKPTHIQISVQFPELLDEGVYGLGAPTRARFHSRTVYRTNEGYIPALHPPATPAEELHADQGHETLANAAQ